MREPASLKAAYLEAAEPAAARAFLEDHIAHWQGELDQWMDEIGRVDIHGTPMLRERLANTPPDDRDRVVAFKRLGCENLVGRARAESAWATRGLALLDDLGYPA